MHIDFNCDLGEGAAHDAELMPLISSANIACGAHAGDEAAMQHCVALALEHGVAIGAHPGYADRRHFGRRELSLSPDEVFRLVLDQIQALRQITARAGALIAHVKPHGALYNQAARDPRLAEAIAAAVYEADPSLAMFGLAGGELLHAAAARGLAAASEVFADRTYQADGYLTPRSQTNALIHDPGTACAQVLRFIREGTAQSLDGKTVKVRADTVCLHGDSFQAVVFARQLRHELQAAGITVKAFSLTGNRR